MARIWIYVCLNPQLGSIFQCSHPDSADHSFARPFENYCLRPINCHDFFVNKDLLELVRHVIHFCYYLQLFSAIGHSREIVTVCISNRNDSLSGPLQKMFVDLWLGCLAARIPSKFKNCYGFIVALTNKQKLLKTLKTKEPQIPVMGELFLEMHGSLDLWYHECDTGG